MVKNGAGVTGISTGRKWSAEGQRPSDTIAQSPIQQAPLTSHWTEVDHMPPSCSGVWEAERFENIAAAQNKIELRLERRG